MKNREIKFRPRTDAHDLKHKMKKVHEFLERGDNVRMVVNFRGREMAHQDIGINLLNTMVLSCIGIGVVSTPVRVEGKTASVIIAPARR